MGSEREHEPADEGADAGGQGSGEPKHDSRGLIQSAEWTTSTYRSSRKHTDVPGKTSKPPRRKPNATHAPDDDEEHEEN